MPMQPYSTGVLVLQIEGLPEHIDVLIAHKTGAVFAGVRRPHPQDYRCEELTEAQYRLLTTAIAARGIALNPMQHGLAEIATLPVWANHGLERKVLRKLFELGIAAGYAWDVNDGEDTVLRQSQDLPALLEAIGSTEEEYLTLRWPLGGRSGSLGQAYIVYGNGFWEVICDGPTVGALATILDGEEFKAFVDGLEERFA